MLESWVPLSKSLIWELLQKYYISLGVDAWKNKFIPSWLTTNAYIAGQYAQLIVRHIENHPQRRYSPNRQNAPFFTILELGAGHGYFGFLLLQHLTTMSKDSSIKLPNFRYIMTDLAERNISFWQECPQLEPFIKSRLLDFAIFKAGTDQEIHLIHSGETISINNPVDHIITIANYFFDSLPIDYFKISNRTLYECQVAAFAKEGETIVDVTDPGIQNKIELHWHEKEISLPYYDNPELNHILATYADMSKNFYFSLPVCGYETLRILKELCRHEIVVISADKGFCSLEQIQLGSRKPPTLYCQGIFSFMVNYPAFGQWFENSGGFYEITSERKGLIELALYCSDGPREKYRELYRAFTTTIEPFSPMDYSNLIPKINHKKKPPSLTRILAILRLSRYDPDIFYQYRDAIRKHIKVADSAEIGDLKCALPKVLKMYYHLSLKDIPFEVGRLYQVLKMFKEAIENYNQSIALFGDHCITYYNLGLCYYSLESFESALKSLKQSQKIEPDLQTKKWIDKVGLQIGSNQIFE
jgi:tetratricopeptide (TPR) repeat protein